MKSYILISVLAVLLSVSACTDFEKTIDDRLQFAINTAYNSQGLSFYRIPLRNQLHLIPQDIRNPLTAEKVRLGKLLFHEPGFGTLSEFLEMKQTYSCASCHHALGGFQANLTQGIGDGGIGFGGSGEGRQIDLFVEMSKVDVQSLRTPSVLNIAYQTNVEWNGQFGATGVNEGTESVWPQEGPVATNRLGYEGIETQAISAMTTHRHKIDESAVTALGYRELFDKAFPSIEVSQRYSNETGALAIAAFERTILAYDSPYQRWLRGSSTAMSDAQKEGAILFFTKGRCNDCHNGANLASMEFHAIGLNDFEPSKVANFETGDPLNKGRSSFTQNEEDAYKFKVPQLYNLKDSPFYGHGASFNSVKELITYKNLAIPENEKVPESQLSPYFQPLDLSEEEIELLSDFVENALYDPSLARYVPRELPSGMCFPNNDWMSRTDLGCE